MKAGILILLFLPYCQLDGKNIAFGYFLQGSKGNFSAKNAEKEWRPFSKNGFPSKRKYERSIYYFMRAGFNFPVGAFSKNPALDPSYEHIKPFSENTGMGASRGIAYELGVTYTFKPWQPLEEQNIKLWWYLTAFRYSANSFSWKDRGGFWATDSMQYTTDFDFLSFLKIGPGFTRFINDKVFICGFYQLDPTISHTLIQDEVSFSGPWSFKMDGEGYGLRHSLGIMLSAYGAQFAIDWNFGKIKYEFTRSFETWNPTGIPPSWQNQTDYPVTKTKTSTVTFTLGLSLGNTLK
jgi:hypothetical protein